VTRIVQATMPQDRTAVHDLFFEYLRWVCARIHKEYQAVFDADSIVQTDMEKIDIFLPPRGFLLLAQEDGAVAGCACVRTIANGVAELKRMYVRPEFRQKGIGKGLVQEAIGEARAQRFRTMKLDSAGFMAEAHTLYRSFGFNDTPPYEGSEIPVQYHNHWVFMQLEL